MDVGVKVAPGAATGLPRLNANDNLNVSIAVYLRKEAASLGKTLSDLDYRFPI